MANQTPPHRLNLRERLILQGAQTLSDAELLAIIIGFGNAKKTCLQLAEDLLLHFGNLRTLLQADFEAFQKIPGVGSVRFAQLQAAAEICRRNDYIALQHLSKLTHTQDTAAFLKRRLRDKKYETFAVLFLDNHYRVLAYEELFIGTINTTTIHPRPLIERILKVNAAAVIFAHNHPSGVSVASEEDRRITAHLHATLALIEVKLLDHLVIGDNEVTSIMHAQTWVCH